MQRISRQWASAKRHLPRARDIVAIAVCLIAAADTIYLRRHSPTVAIEGVLTGGAALALWWRRRFPLWVTLVGVAVTLLTGAAAAAVVGLTTFVVRRRDRTAAALTVATIAAAVIGPRLTLLHSTVDQGDLVHDLVNMILAIGFVVAVGAYVGVRRDLVSSLKERAERAEAEREVREERGRLDERTRIAREMHDVLAHKVSLIALQAGALEVTNDPSNDTVRASAALIRQTARQALEDLREVLGVLRDANGDVRTSLAPQATLADIPALVESSRLAGLPVTITGSADLTEPTAELIGRAAFRLVQEALTNVHKHARNAATTLRFDGRPGGRLDIEIVNLAPVGAGLLLPGSGLGLVGLRERFELVGGTFAAGPTAEGGFRVRGSLPWLVDEFAVRPVSRT
ncbi:MAG: histidine kinase [Ilumatobacteraceae bacterium]|nr:histidine kinase [Ilumatobacteraceae bacterium]